MILTRVANSLYSPTDYERYSGRNPVTKATDNRDGFERDHGRLIHSFAFRRLQAKTQVLAVQEGDAHRTRLTHSLEVANLARGIALHLNATTPFPNNGKIDISLVESAALAHDLGHPPFGHHGEVMLNKFMWQHGGFEGNAQMFRILTRLEGPAEGKTVGLDLSRAVLLAVVKYPATYEQVANDAAYGNPPTEFRPPKFSVYSSEMAVFEWLLSGFSNEERGRYQEVVHPTDADKTQGRTKHVSLECSIINAADDIAYATHDTEDALGLGLVSVAEVLSILESHRDICSDAIARFGDIGTKTPFSRFEYKRAVAEIIHVLVTNTQISEQVQFESPRLSLQVTLPPEHEALVRDLNKLIMHKVILSHPERTLEWRGARLIGQVFEAVANSPKELLPDNDLRAFEIAVDESEELRVVCDYIAGMTDSYLMRLYQRLFEPRFASVFERI